MREDDEIGPLFNQEVQSWEAHLALLKDFWPSVLLATGRYKGNPLVAHFRLPIEEKHFGRWLDLFAETASEVMLPQHAAIVSQKAHLIAIKIKRVLASRT